MKNISLNIDKALGTVTKEQVYAQAAKAHECNATLQNGNGAGNDFLGWLHLPSSITDAELTDIENTANVLRSKCEVVVAIGIGGMISGFAQGKAAVSGIALSAKDDSNFSKAMVSVTLVEIYALLSFIVSLLVVITVPNLNI